MLEIKLKRGNDETTRPRKVASMINSVNSIWKQSNRNIGISKYLSVITLNLNRLTSHTKRYRLPDWVKKRNPIICSLQETHLTTKNAHKLKVKGSKKTY
jgi:hypothetical protein